MNDRATPNLPSRDFDVTCRFYAALGFEQGWRDSGWMILSRGTATLEIFPHPALDPAASDFGCCLRLDDLDGFVVQVVAAGIEDKRTGWPRHHPPVVEHWGGRVGYLVDPDGTLLRLVDNRTT